MEENFDSVPEIIDATTKVPSPNEVNAAGQEHSAHFDGGALALAGPYPAVNTLLEDSSGVYGYYSESNRYGIAETIEAILEVGRILSQRYPGKRFGVGDISKQGGGPIDGHASHQNGIDFDVRLLRMDWEEAAIVYQNSAYSRKLTQELIDLFWTNSNLAVEFVFFNDAHTQGTRPWPNHDNHFHVRFHPPGIGSAPPLLQQGNQTRAANNELQRILNNWQRAVVFPGPALVVDGDFGPNTHDRLRDFQTAAGIEPADGIAGQNTWEKLQQWRV